MIDDVLRLGRERGGVVFTMAALAAAAVSQELVAQAFFLLF